MLVYDRDESQDYDDELEGGGEYDEDGEEEYEEEEPPKPTKEELEYLELRQKLKESIRKQMKKENSNPLADSASRKKQLPYDNYGSFFGPSQPVIAQRVIQESKSLLENQQLTSLLSNSPHINKCTNKVSNNGVLKSSARNNIPPKVSEKKVKAQKLKVTRDYSFLLSDDVELPAPKKETPSQKIPVHNSGGRPAQVAGKSKQPLVNGGKIARGNDENRKLVTGAGHLASKSGSNYKLSSTNKSIKASADSRKQMSSNSGNGPGRPVGPKGLPSKMPVTTMANKSLTPGTKNLVNGVQKPLPSKLHSVNGLQKPLSSKLHSSLPKQSVEQRKDPREQNKPKMISTQPLASTKAQINKPLKQIPKPSDLQGHRPKNKVGKRYYDEAEDEMDVSRMIRSMFNYNPNKFVDDDDDDDMEAGFDEIMKEEKRSAIIAKKEDEEQLRLIEEEEERERRRRLAKKRKLG